MTHNPLWKWFNFQFTIPSFEDSFHILALAKINFANLSPISTLSWRDCWHSHRSRVGQREEGGKIPHLNEFSSDRSLSRSHLASVASLMSCVAVVRSVTSSRIAWMRGRENRHVCICISYVPRGFLNTLEKTIEWIESSFRRGCTCECCEVNRQLGDFQALSLVPCSNRVIWRSIDRRCERTSFLHRREHLTPSRQGIFAQNTWVTKSVPPHKICYSSPKLSGRRIAAEWLARRTLKSQVPGLIPGSGKAHVEWKGYSITKQKPGSARR